MEQRPSFFKFILPNASASKQLRIPPKFVKHIERYVPGQATLRGPSGDCWPVKLRKDGNEVFVKDGWHRFFKGHSLGDSEFLVFIQYGKACFDVRVYNKDGLERVNVHQSDDSQNSISFEHDLEDETKSESAGDTERHREATTYNERRKCGYESENGIGEASSTKLCEAAMPTNVKRKRGRPRKIPNCSIFTCKDVEVKNGIIQLSDDEANVKLEGTS